MPGVDGVVELHAGIGAGPGGAADLSQRSRALTVRMTSAVGAAGELPVGVLAHRVEEGVGDPDGVVGVLAGDGDVGLGVPVGVVRLEVDRGVALLA